MNDDGALCLQPDKRFLQSELVSDRHGAGEPLGEPVPPPGTPDRQPDEMRSKLPDDLVDGLRAAADSEEIVGPGGC